MIIDDLRDDIRTLLPVETEFVTDDTGTDWVDGHGEVVLKLTHYEGAWTWDGYLVDEYVPASSTEEDALQWYLAQLELDAMGM